MNSLHPYCSKTLQSLEDKYPWEKAYLQAVQEVFASIGMVLEQAPLYQHENILERVTEPERIYIFRVPWRDDTGAIQVNTGYRVGFNSALGPYKGGLRFHPSVNLDIFKFLGFEQTFKNALTGLPLGGGKGGSDFNPRNRSDQEIERFCQSFMTSLYQHIGPNTDVPAGDIGVGAREIGFLFGQYKRLKNSWEGVFTGKGLDWGGSYLRPEATGFGAVYFAEEMLKTKGDGIDGKTIAVSGFGNVAWGVVTKASQMGGKVVTLSGPDGFIHDPEGIQGEKIDYMLAMRRSNRDRVEDYAEQFKVEFHPGKRPWGVACDLAFPCACENELDGDDARNLLNNGCQCVTECANMPATKKAMEFLLESPILYSPGKASNAAGVACSGLEMAQNSGKIRWPSEEVDHRLRTIMVDIHETCLHAAEQFGKKGNYFTGANIAGFIKVANAMIDHGNV
ncbi:MAG: NADP-specific glutamate dehydrogenase [Proteobacteria bacterium]|nr:MAG: NADP-specific glutamate dehydrogenase [Pseudomonadota bacterium]PIE68083.1 MAG: NADP-specific glutamate dehydrogenase [Deltaproteobacteria bacterium]